MECLIGSFVYVLLTLFRFAVFATVKTINRPPLRRLPLGLSLSSTKMQSDASQVSIIRCGFGPGDLVLPTSLVAIKTVNATVSKVGSFRLFSHGSSIGGVQVSSCVR